jgi:hypothetical protein
MKKGKKIEIVVNVNVCCCDVKTPDTCNVKQPMLPVDSSMVSEMHIANIRDMIRNLPSANKPVDIDAGFEQKIEQDLERIKKSVFGMEEQLRWIAELLQKSGAFKRAGNECKF